MSKTVLGLLTVALSLGAMASTLHAADLSQGGFPSTVFVMTNDTVKNEVLAYEKLFDERLTLKERFATGGRGSGGTTDPLQSQGLLTLSGDHNLLFAISKSALQILIGLSPKRQANRFRSGPFGWIEDERLSCIDRSSCQCVV